MKKPHRRRGDARRRSDSSLFDFAEHGSLGPKPTDDEMSAATPDDRIAAVWRILIGIVRRFHDNKMTPHQRQNYSVEDLLLEVYIEMRAKDSGWNPSNGRYSTYASTIVNHLLIDIGDRATVVHAPRNSSTKIKRYDPDDPDHARRERRRQSAESVNRVRDGSVGVLPDDRPDRSSDGGDPASAVPRGELEAAINAALGAAGAYLDDAEAFVLNWRRETARRKRRSYKWIAGHRGLSVSEVKEIEKRAIEKAIAVITRRGIPLNPEIN